MIRKTFWLGLFLIGALFGATWLLLFLKPSFGDGKTLLKVRFSNIERINKGTRVNFAGKPVGDVEAIHRVPNARSLPPDLEGEPYIYELVLRVDSSVHVYTYDQILFSTSGLLGEKTVAIIPKATPQGAMEAQDITDTILYGRSTDQIEQMLNTFESVATSINDTFQDLGSFLTKNEKKIDTTLDAISSTFETAKQVFHEMETTHLIPRISEAATSLHQAMGQTTSFLTQAEESQLLSKAVTSIDHLNCFLHKAMSPCSTVGKLLNSDATYLQITASLQKLETTLNDINQYGLLFQYDKGWQKKRVQKRKEMACLKTPCDFYLYLNNEILDISVILTRMQSLVEALDCKDLSISDECLLEKFRELMNKAQNLERRLELYNEKFISDYYNRCCEEPS